VSPLAPPPADLAGFPRHRLLPSRALFRIHRAEHAPWWFSSDGAGRFDLASPAGTCYLAEDAVGAFVEVFRFTTIVPEIEVRERRLSTLRAPDGVVLANCAARRARAFGITAEIHTGPDYALTQVWAAAFATAGFDGVRYLLSHDPAQRCVGFALFGPGGRSTLPVHATDVIGRNLIDQARRRFGIRVLPAPSTR
jgi:hypothetical protein